LILHPSPSAMRIKRKGERGSPFLMPREGEKGMEGDPLTRMEKKSMERRESTHLIQEPRETKCLQGVLDILPT
jgi:hypothetical protein